MKQQDLLFWIWLAEAVGPDSPDFRYLIDLYQSPYDVFRAGAAELERVERLSPRAVRALSDKNLRGAQEILRTCEADGIGIIPYSSPLYPQLLREIPHPPVLLYSAGTVPGWDRRLCVGMVGTRRMSEYGMEAAYKISYALSRANAVIVSGMAAGVDGVCAAAALQAGGCTVAVLGCGLDRAYPPHHGLLMREIAAHGLLLSEYPPGTPPLPYHFPVRNRILSGLSHGVVVVEAGEGSGSMITAGEAVRQGRDVFAVPSAGGAAETGGANGLLRDGAIFTADASDICRRYAYLFAETLHPEEARAPAQADTEWLRRLGVLKLRRAPRQPAPTGADGGPAARKTDAPAAESGAPAAEQKARRPKPAAPATEQTARVPVPPEPAQAAPARAHPQDPVQERLLDALADGQAQSVDGLSARLGLPAGELQTALLMLELDGAVSKLPGGRYRAGQ